MTTNNQPTPPAQEGLDLEAIIKRREAAFDMVSRLCKGERWTMSVPADHRRDSDLVIADSLADVPALVAELQQARGRIAELEAEIKEYQDLVARYASGEILE